MEPNATPTRIIYAKLTTTGAYDVVAHAPGVTLEEARTLAEQLLPGNPPLDANAGELIGYVRTAQRHVVLRFSRYAWKDGDRGDVYSTDILLLPDDAFRRVRCNPFAVVPRSDDVFDVLTELPPPVIEQRSATDEHTRLQQLAGVRNDARTVIANALAAEPVLLLHTGNAADVLELFMLLLPPSLRPQLTFLTQTFRVPAIMPRVTVVDRQTANLRGGAWTVLPSPQVDVPMQLGGLLIALADDADVLALTHELYDEAYADAAAAEPRALRTGVERVVRLAAVAESLRRNDAPASLRRLAERDTDARERTAALRRLRTGDAEALRRAYVQMLGEGGTSAAAVQALIAADDHSDPAVTSALVTALPGNAATDLVLTLAARAAAEGNVPQLIELLTRDRRAVAAQLERAPGRVPADFARLLDALRRAMGPHYDITAAAQLLTEASAIHSALANAATAERLHGICRQTVEDALQHVPAHVRAVAPLRQLNDAAAAYRAAHADASSLPLPIGTNEDAQRFAAAYPQACSAALGAALLDRALDAHTAGRDEQTARDVALAHILIQPAGSAGRELVRHLLSQRGVSEHDLVAVPGAETLVPLLGGTAAQAAITRRVITAIARAAAQEDGIGELASAVYAAHTQHVRIVPGSETSQRVIEALRAFERSHDSRVSAAAELCLELLGVITPPAHMVELEDAALGSHMTVRLRRLDRGIAVCRAAEDEQRYDRIAHALETDSNRLEADARARLMRALGTGGMSRRLMRMVASVVEKEAS